MRLIFLALVVFALVLVVGVGLSQGGTRACPPDDGAAPTQAQSPAVRRASLILCNFCEEDSDCREGEKCCGPSHCLQCQTAAYCEQVQELDPQLKPEPAPE